jgi:hypothetical protein
MKNLRNLAFLLALSVGTVACGESITGPDGYTPDPGSYTPDPGSYTPDPGSYTPDPGSYTPDPGS